MGGVYGRSVYGDTDEVDDPYGVVQAAAGPVQRAGYASPLPFLPTATPSLLTTTPPAPLSLFNNKSLPSSSTLPDLR
jgi:hypothetical protein